MIWESMIGHREQMRRFARMAQRQKIPSTFLFAGPEGIGKRLFAHGLAEFLLCPHRDADAPAACGRCLSCRQVQSLNHPDLLIVEKPADKNALPIELFVGDREHRSQTGLCRDIRVKPQTGSRRFAIIDDADYLNIESANVLLKTLEEPPPHAIIILIGTSPQRQLSTILSRSQLIKFSPLSPDELTKLLERNTSLESPIAKADLAQAASGSIKVAYQLADPKVYEFRQTWLEQLSSLDPGQEDFAAAIIKFAETGAKEAAAKRENLYFVGDQGIAFYRQLLNRLTGLPLEGDAILREAVENAAGRWTQPATQIGWAIERLTDFQSHIELNANPQNAVEPLLADLRRIALGRAPAVIEI